MESSVPPGFRFHPTDEELVGYYLKKKIASQKIDLDVIRDIDLYRIEPWDLQERCRIGYEEQNEWYFFSHKDKKYPTGTRTNRATLAGFWKATGRDKAVYDKGKLIGMRKTLVFYKGRAPNGHKSDWIMHEYRLESDENGPPQEEGWVVCRAFKKKATSCNNNNNSQSSKNMEGWDSSYVLYDETSQLSSSIMVDPIFMSRQTQSTSFLTNNNLHCKQELDSNEALLLANFIHNNNNNNHNNNNNNNNNNNSSSSTSIDHNNNNFLQLPQLESPSQISSLISRNTTANYYSNVGDKVTDWRSLDKFVASQLSENPNNALVINQGNDHHKNRGSGDGVSGFNYLEESCGSEIEAILMMHGSIGREEYELSEGSKLVSGFLSSNSFDSDHNIFGACLYNK